MKKRKENPPKSWEVILWYLGISVINAFIYLMFWGKLEELKEISIGVVFLTALLILTSIKNNPDDYINSGYLFGTKPTGDFRIGPQIIPWGFITKIYRFTTNEIVLEMDIIGYPNDIKPGEDKVVPAKIGIVIEIANTKAVHKKFSLKGLNSENAQETLEEAKAMKSLLGDLKNTFVKLIFYTSYEILSRKDDWTMETLEAFFKEMGIKEAIELFDSLPERLKTIGFRILQINFEVFRTQGMKEALDNLSIAEANDAVRKVEAETRKQVTIVNAEAEAEAIKKRGFAEALIIKEKGGKEAEVLKLTAKKIRDSGFTDFSNKDLMEKALVIMKRESLNKQIIQVEDSEEIAVAVANAFVSFFKKK